MCLSMSEQFQGVREEKKRREYPFGMHASVVTNVGIVVDAFIIERCINEAEIMNKGVSSHMSNISRSSAVLFSSRTTGTPHLLSVMSPLTTLAPSSASSSGHDTIVQPTLYDDAHYECNAIGRPLPQRIFHIFDVLPFGFECPSSVFGVIGRHLNRGLVLGMTHNGLFIVHPYSVGPLQLSVHGPNRKCVSAEAVEELTRVCRSTAARESLSLFFEKAARIQDATDKAKAEEELTSESPPRVPTKRMSRSKIRGDDDSADDNDKKNDFEASDVDDMARMQELLDGTELWALKDLQLPPALALHEPVAPLRVGSRVVARRFGCAATLHTARIMAVRYDVTYTLRYTSDDGVDVGVLHNDIHLIDDTDAEQCAVRDHVTVALQKQLPAVIIECLGGEEYRVILESNPDQALTVTRRHIVFVAPLLKEALYADPLFVEWFRALDPSRSGFVPWKEVRHAILEWETFGQPLSFQKLGEIQRDLCIHVRRVEPQMLRKVPVQIEEMLLRYPEFEYVIQRARNMM